MKLLRLFALPFVLSFGVSGVAAPIGVTTPEQVLPQLDQILKQAVTQSPQMISRALELELAEQDRFSHRAALLPTVGGTYSYYQSREDRADLAESLSVPKQYYNFSVTQPLFHWGERRNTARMGEIRKLISEGNYRQGYRLLAQEVRSSYLRLILSKIRVQRAAHARDNARNQLKIGEQRIAQKVISDAQMFGIRINAERSEIDQEKAVFEFENERQTFRRLTGLPVLAESDIPDSIPAVAHQADAVQGLLASYLAQKDKPSTEAVNFLAAMDIERLRLANNKTRLRPKFNLVAGISQDEQRYAALGSKYQVKSTYGGFSATWSIFDGFSARSEVRSSLARIRQMENDFRALDERLAQQAQSQARLAGFQARYCSINDRFLESAEGNLKAKREEFTRGVTSEEDVGAAQIGVYDSQLNAYASRADYYTQVSEFLGTIMEDPALANLALVK